jgi:hypothetical protein
MLTNGRHGSSVTRGLRGIVVVTENHAPRVAEVHFIRGDDAAGMIPPCLNAVLRGEPVNTFNNAWPPAASVMHTQPSSPDSRWLRSLPHRDQLEMDACDTAPRIARQWLGSILKRWALEQFTDDATLVASELITNSAAETGKVEWVRRPPVGLRLHGGPSVLVMKVWDAVIGAPVPRAAAEDDESGRGLAIVAGLSTSCGFYYCEKRGGKVTWATFGTQGSRGGKLAWPGLRTLLLTSRPCRQQPSRFDEGR